MTRFEQAHLQGVPHTGSPCCASIPWPAPDGTDELQGPSHPAWPRHRSTPQLLVHWPEPATVSSTRRFCARPSDVSFEATGSASPNPRADSRLGLTPREIMNCITLSARFCD